MTPHVHARLPWTVSQQRNKTVLVHLASGIGNIVLATPLLLALHRHGFVVDLLLDADYPETADLFLDWQTVRAVYSGHNRPRGRYDVRVPAIPPFYWGRFQRSYRGRADAVARPPDELFYRDERAYYLKFAQALGCGVDDHLYAFLPVAPALTQGVSRKTLVLAPGCKTSEMAAKRWPYFDRLAEFFADVAIVGTADDLHRFDGSPIRFPDHVRLLTGRLTLRETAGVLAACGAVVANDSGLGHLAAALGVPTILLFGPTPHLTLGRFPPNVTVLRAGLPCEPCWRARPLSACGARVDCLAQLPVDAAVAAIRAGSALGQT